MYRFEGKVIQICLKGVSSPSGGLGEVPAPLPFPAGKFIYLFYFELLWISMAVFNQTCWDNSYRWGLRIRNLPPDGIQGQCPNWQIFSSFQRPIVYSVLVVCKTEILWYIYKFCSEATGCVWTCDIWYLNYLRLKLLTLKT